MATSMRNTPDDWDTKPGLTAAITALTPGPWKTELAAANTLFAEKYLARAQETGAHSTENSRNKRNKAYEVS